MGLISIAFQVSVAITVFSFALSADRDDLLFAIRRPRLLLISLLAMFVVTPVVALALESYFDFPHAARVAIVVISLSPIPALLPRNQISSGGKSSYAYGLALAVSLLSIVIVPVMVDFVGRVMDRPFAVEVDTIARSILITVLAPLALGLVVQRMAPAVSARVQQALMGAANAVLTAALLLLLVLVFRSIFESLTWRSLAAAVLFVVCGLAVGHLLGGPEPDHSVVLAIACANRNPGIAIAIASENFPRESFGPTVIMYAIVVGFVSTPYVNWQKRRAAASSAAGTSPVG